MFSGEDSRDQHTRIHARSSPGFLERLGETVGGMVVGVVIFCVSFYVLFTNEGRAIRTASSLDEGLSKVITLHPDISADPQNNGHLVHLSASLHTAQPLYDPNYRVAVQAVKLKRNVEMYQWVEYQESRDYQENGETKTETTYSYNTEWKSEIINSRHFDKEIGHVNPSAMAVESVTVVAPDVWVGHFSLSKGLIDQINNFQTLSLNALPFTDPFLTVYQDYFYHTANPRRPEVGDVRVSFSYAGLSGEGSFPGPAQKVSVVAMQKEDKLMPFKTKSGDTLEILYLEELTPEEVFAREQQYNMMKTWALRAGGWLLMLIGINLTMRIFYTLGNLQPPHPTHTSGLGPCPERAGVCGCENLCRVCVLLALSPHHLPRLAVLSPPGGHTDCCSCPSAHPHRTRS
ncbi:transmembrane protein 43 isoform X2 [Tachysurus fulvidraco]|uniref:transmembrane protein 43 isoform X2 n=1 Tax=Tachysurus fulvidraco TaxID=1234273 RepID=UPI001FEE0321|nr:transmembrane protein 43 isoform X2 [Tachysurus fulvidraco]